MSTKKEKIHIDLIGSLSGSKASRAIGRGGKGRTPVSRASTRDTAKRKSIKSRKSKSTTYGSRTTSRATR